MAQPWFPKHNVPQETKDWANKIQKMALDAEARDAEHDRLLRMLLGQNNAGARQTTNLNLQISELASSRGLPGGDQERRVLRTTETARPYWSGELLDQRITYSIGLGAGASYSEAFAGSSNSAVPLPMPIISDDEKELDWLLTPEGDGFPLHIELLVFPESDLDVFTVALPSSDNDFGNTVPFWSFRLLNASDTFRARLQIQNNGLMYAGTNIPVMGDDDQWDLEPMFHGAWSVENGHRAYRANAATPLAVAANSGLEGGPMVMDRWFVENVRGRNNMYPFTATGTVATGVLKQRFYNDTAATQWVTSARASVATAPTGANLTVDVKVDGVTAFTTTVVAAAVTGTATPPAGVWPLKIDPVFDIDVDFFAVEWPVGSYLTVDVTQVGSTVAGSDLTVQVWAG